MTTSPTTTPLRRWSALALVAAGALALPAGAAAATATLDRPCYVAGHRGTLTLSGYAPGAQVAVRNRDLGSTTIPTDATGSATTSFMPPTGNDLTRPGSRTFAVTATDLADPADTSTATSRIAPLAFSTDRGTKSPKAKRRWYFSGWGVGKYIYAHFRLGGRTLGTFRFGRATGPCGEDRRQAPAIAVAGRVRTGRWVVQVDQVKSYRASTKVRLVDEIPVYTTSNRRAAGLSAAAPFLHDAFQRSDWG